MLKTLFVYETKYGSTGEAVKKLALILGPANWCRTGEFKPEMRDAYDFFVIGGPVWMEKIDPRLQTFVESNRDWLKLRKTALFTNSLSRGGHALNPLKPLQQLLADTPLFTGGILGRCILTQLDKPDYDSMAKFCEMVKIPFKDMDMASLPNLTQFGLDLKDQRQAIAKTIPREELKKTVEDFILSHNTLTLCTGAGNLVRATPVEFKYKDGAVYIVTEGGAKFAGLLANKEVSLAIHDPYHGPGPTAGLVLTGKAEFSPPGTPLADEVMAVWKLNPQKIAALPFKLNTLKVTLNKAEFLCIAFKDRGFEVYQTLNF